MFQLRQTVNSAFDPMLVREPVLMRAPLLRDFEAWEHLRRSSRAHLTRWEDDWCNSDIALTAFRRRLRAWERQRRLTLGFSLFAFLSDEETLIGGVTLSHIHFGASQSAVIGYWVGQGHLRCGYGRLMVDETVAHAFDVLGLNRVEAACQPENIASAKLLRGLGFQREGCARGYLRINGEWRDHDIYARIAGDPDMPADN